VAHDREQGIKRGGWRWLAAAQQMELRADAKTGWMGGHGRKNCGSEYQMLWLQRYICRDYKEFM
jgi:hypothetical protein